MPADDAPKPDEPIAVAALAPAAPLDYAGASTTPAAPVGSFAFGAILFGATHLLADSFIAGTQTQVFSRWPPPPSPGTWAYYHEQFYELGLTTAAVLIVFAVQWAGWRVRPVDRPRRVGSLALACGLAYCAVGWALYWRSDRPPFNAEAAQAIVKCGLAALIGCALAWWRARGANTSSPPN